MDIHLAYFGAYLWLDNKRLIFPLIQRSVTYATMVIINPFTGETIELASDYPGIAGTMAGPVGNMAFGYSSVVYDPSLNLVIFPVRDSPLNYIELWDRRGNSILAKVEDKGEFLNYPLWSPDANQFAVAVLQQVNGSHYIEDWFRVSREGQVEQLTHFEYFFVDAEIGDGNWSPDGQKLAFWLDVSTGPCPGAHLAVLELKTKQVTDTCIPGALEYAPPPIWSLDSRNIGVRNARLSPDQMILVDFEQGRAFDITQYGIPIGWLASP